MQKNAKNQNFRTHENDVHYVDSTCYHLPLAQTLNIFSSQCVQSCGCIYTEQQQAA